MQTIVYHIKATPYLYCTTLVNDVDSMLDLYPDSDFSDKKETIIFVCVFNS